MSKNLRILIVDDNEEFCRNVTDILELRGFEPAAVTGGPEALEAVRGDGFDLVLMDVKMPVMNGVETFKRLKKISPDTPVLMVTAFAVEDLIQEALRQGAFGAIHKPIDFEKLFSIIDTATINGGLILVVDDDENTCRNLSDILTGRGFRVRTAGNGEEAINMVRENRFDLMILDMKLPRLNGLETYLAMREVRPDLVTILITGYMGELGDLVENTIEKSAYTCLEKPLDMDKLLALIDRIREGKAKGDLKKPGRE
jgi:two-component system response regulator HydG